MLRCKPFYKKARQCWYVQIRDQQIKLGPDKEEAFKEFHRLMASDTPVTNKTTVPAMLTAGESVINAKSSRRFFSQIQAMNAGHAPVFRQDGGSVDNSVHVGDVTVSDAQAVKVRELVKEINRSTRRGASRLN
jgi:hypothetical protein